MRYRSGPAARVSRGPTPSRWLDSVQLQDHALAMETLCDITKTQGREVASHRIDQDHNRSSGHGSTDSYTCRFILEVIIRGIFPDRTAET